MSAVLIAGRRRPCRMPAVDRRHRILERVAEEQTIHIRELAAELDVSEMTIRRDITPARARRLPAPHLRRRDRPRHPLPRARLQRPRPAERAGEAPDRRCGRAAGRRRRDHVRRHRHAPPSSSRSLPARARRRDRGHQLAARGQPARHAPGPRRHRSAAACAATSSAASGRWRPRPCAATTPTSRCSAPPGSRARHGVTELDDETAEVHRLMAEHADRPHGRGRRLEARRRPPWPPSLPAEPDRRRSSPTMPRRTPRS